VYENLDKELIESIKQLIAQSKKSVSQHINHVLIHTYWSIGKEIVSTEQKKQIDNLSSRQLILDLSKTLTQEFGNGFSRSNLFNMRKFYLEYPDVQTLSGHLSWSHICEIIHIEDKQKRSFYELECVESKWSFRELKRQIDSSLFERLLLSDGSSNKEKIVKLAKSGQEISQAEDILKSPYVFEFLGIPEHNPIYERELEHRLILHLEHFLLELGKGFMFVGTQQRVTLNNQHHYVDMVFYNKILRSYILIDLKARKLEITDGGQLNTYLNYYKTEINDPDDNPPIGIILCTEKDEIAAEYILSGFDNNVFASKYTLVLPNKDRLIDELNQVINSRNE